MYVSLLIYIKILYTITLMMIMILQDRNTHFAYIGVPYITYRNASKRRLYFYSCFYYNKNVIKMCNYSR